MKLRRFRGLSLAALLLALIMLLLWCFQLGKMNNLIMCYVTISEQDLKQQQAVVRESVQISSSKMAPTSNSARVVLLGNESCPSHHQTKNNRNEHSPIIFKAKNLMVCRTPKVGSNELRSVGMAFENDTPFEPPLANVPYKGNTLAGIENSTEFNHYLYDDTVTRVMFVRHPVHRLLSGFLETARSERFWTAHGFETPLKDKSPEFFRQWVMNETLFYKHFHSDCNEKSNEFDLDSMVQHWAPPQHCRCGIHDCGVKWDAYKIEEHSIQSVLKNYLSQKYLPPANATKIFHKRRYSKKDYLTDDVLEYLNSVTRKEREFFGYEPLTINDL